MRDSEIRIALNQLLYRKYKLPDPDCMVVDEFGLCQGIARIDIAVINGVIHGYEIKSEQDTLRRVYTQLSVYAKTLDKLTFVINQKHLIPLKKQIPGWCGIMLAEHVSSRIEITTIRNPKTNPNVDPYSVAQLLWKNEAVAILRDLGYTKGTSNKTRSTLWKQLVDMLDSQDLGLFVRDALKHRLKSQADSKQQQYDALRQFYAR